jgi:hypothetical protein
MLAPFCRFPLCQLHTGDQMTCRKKRGKSAENMPCNPFVSINRLADAGLLPRRRHLHPVVDARITEIKRPDRVADQRSSSTHENLSQPLIVHISVRLNKLGSLLFLEQPGACAGGADAQTGKPSRSFFPGLPGFRANISWRRPPPPTRRHRF